MTNIGDLLSSRRLLKKRDFETKKTILSFLIMPSKTKRRGVGAVCSVIKRFLHPRKLVDEKYPNATHNECLDGLIALRRETCTINHQ